MTIIGQVDTTKHNKSAGNVQKKSSVSNRSIGSERILKWLLTATIIKQYLRSKCAVILNISTAAISPRGQGRRESAVNHHVC